MAKHSRIPRLTAFSLALLAIVIGAQHVSATVRHQQSIKTRIETLSISPMVVTWAARQLPVTVMDQYFQAQWVAAEQLARR